MRAAGVLFYKAWYSPSFERPWLDHHHLPVAARQAHPTFITAANCLLMGTFEKYQTTGTQKEYKIKIKSHQPGAYISLFHVKDLIKKFQSVLKCNFGEVIYSHGSRNTKKYEVLKPVIYFCLLFIHFLPPLFFQSPSRSFLFHSHRFHRKQWHTYYNPHSLLLFSANV